MRKRMIAIATPLSFVALVLLCGIYGRSFYARDEITVAFPGGQCAATTFPHHFFIIVSQVPSDVPVNMSIGLDQYPGAPSYLEPRYREAPTYVSIAIPYWLPGLFLLALPLWWVGGYVRKRRRAMHGLCATCGYDIRASRERCPECGTMLTPRRGGATCAA